MYVFPGAVVIGHVPDEQRLYTDLMQSYEPAVRPVLNASRTVIVNFRISLNQIVDLVIVPFLGCPTQNTFLATDLAFWSELILCPTS